MTRPSGRRGRGRGGAATLEMAVALLPTLMLVMGIMEYGRYEMVRQLALNSVRAGARFAAGSKRSATTAQVQAVVLQQLAGQGPTGATITASLVDASGNVLGDWTTAYEGEPIAVQLVGIYTPIVPTMGIIPKTMPVQATAVARCEID